MHLVIAQLKFELAYFVAAVQYFSYYTIETPLALSNNKIKII